MIRVLSIVAIALGSTGVAYAFADSGQFFAPSGITDTATLGASTEGIYFTGAPRYSGLDCASCHTDGPQQIAIHVGADAPELFTGGYNPGQIYELEVSIENESEGLQFGTPTCTEVPSKPGQFPYVQCNNNNFALEIDSANEALSGAVFCAAAPTAGACPMPDANADEVVIALSNDAVLGNRPHSTTTPYELLHNDATIWHLWWTAPPAGSGPLMLYVAAVDGNGGSGNANSDQDPYGDDTVSAAIPLAEAGSQSAFDAGAGCSVARGRSDGSAGVLVFVALLILRRRRARLLRSVWLACFTIGLAACDNSPTMLPGQDCYPCHAPNNGRHGFPIAGTIFPSPASGAEEGLEGATVQITDASGHVISLQSNSVGNFYTNEKVEFPVSVQVQIGDTIRHMEPTTSNGSCNECHAQPSSQGAQGRVYVPTTP